MNKIKILHIIGGTGGGVPTYIKNLIKRTPQEVDITVMAFEKFDVSFYNLIDESHLISMPKPNDQGIFTFFKWLNNFFYINKFDYIECHFYGVKALVFKFFSHIHNSKVFNVHSHQEKLIYGRELKVREKLRVKVDRLLNSKISTYKLACSVGAAKYAFRNQDIIIIPNSIEPTKFMDNNYNKNNSKIVVGHVGNHTIPKNINYFILLAKYLKKIDDHEIVFELVGEGDYTGQLKANIEKFKLEEYFILRGKQQNVEDFYKNFDIFMLPSISEGLPTVLIEAQATGIASVVSNTITKEVDIGLNMIEYLPITETEQDFESWIYTIKDSMNKDIPDNEMIMKALEDKQFTNKKMAEKFLDIVHLSISKKQ